MPTASLLQGSLRRTPAAWGRGQSDGCATCEGHLGEPDKYASYQDNGHVRVDTMWASLGVRELATKPGARPTSDSRLLQQTPRSIGTTQRQVRLRRKTHCPGRPISAGSCGAACRPLPRSGSGVTERTHAPEWIAC